MLETSRLIHYLTDELQVSSNAIALALQQCEQTPNLLPIVLWQYGLITLTELEQIFDWMADSTCVIRNAQFILP